MIGCFEIMIGCFEIMIGCFEIMIGCFEIMIGCFEIMTFCFFKYGEGSTNYNDNTNTGPAGTGGSEKLKSSNDDDTLRDGS